LEVVPERDSDEASSGSGLSLLQHETTNASSSALSGFDMQFQMLQPGRDRNGLADGEAELGLGFAASQVGRGSGASVNLGGMNFIAQSKEWNGLGMGSTNASSLEAAPVDRRQRYMNVVPENAELVQVQSPQPAGVDANVLRCLAWCFYFVEMVFGAASIFVLSLARRWIYVLMLLPFHLLLICLEVYGVRHDNCIEKIRRRLRKRPAACLRGLSIVLLEVSILLFFGLFNLFPLIRARRCWRQSGRGAKRRFIDEIEGTAGYVNPPSARLDSHIMFLTGVPRMVVLTNVLARKDGFIQDPLSTWIVSTTVAISLLSVVLAVVHFDYYASKWIRKQYEVAQFFFFHMLHITYRMFEVAGRVLILVAITEIFRWHLYSGVAILLLDYLLGIAALLRVTGFVPGSFKMMLVLSVSIYVADVCRYIDEPGLTRQARKVSTFCTSLRFLEVIMALALYGHWAHESAQPEGGLQGADAERLLVLTVLLHATCLFMMACTRIGHKGTDLFLACMRKAVSESEIEEILRGGCDVNLSQMDHTRETALHAAAALGKASAVNLLLLHGADPCLVDAEGENPLHKACRAGHAEVIEGLLQPPETAPCAVGGTCQAAALQRNANGETPLDVLRPRAPWRCRQLVLEAQRIERGTFAGDVDMEGVDGGSQPLRKEGEAVITRSLSSELSQNLFGSVVSRSHNRLSPTSSMPSGLASFMFSTGIGDQLSEVFDLMQESGHDVKFSNFTIEGGLLGSGSFGRVFKVKDRRSGEAYALKLQRRDKTTKIAVREVQALLKSAHAFIVRLNHMFQTDTFYVLLMELCDKNLNSRILECLSDQKRPEGLPDEVTVRYTACITLALEYVHRLKIVFRDVKPENILTTFTEKGDYAKLTDFGLARSIEATEIGSSSDGADTPDWISSGGREATPPRMLAASVVCGTPRFMSEEVYETFTPSPHAESSEEWLRWNFGRDWYALGLTLLLMLLGEDGGVRVEHSGRQVLLPPENQREVWKKIRWVVRDRQAEHCHLPNDEALDLVVALTGPVRDRAGAKELRASNFLQPVMVEMEREVKRFEDMMEVERSPARRSQGSNTCETPSDRASEVRGRFGVPGRLPHRHARTRSCPADPT